MKSRQLSDILKLKSGTRFGRIIVLTGARQTGKTTLARKVFPDYTYLSIEDPVTRGAYLDLTAGQWSLMYPYAVLDEVQKEPQLIESVKSVYDQFDEPRYVLLGSSQILLLSKVKESLAGRCMIYEVFPLTIPELITKSWEQNIKPSFIQGFINDGKLPQLPSSFLLLPDYAEVTKNYRYYLDFGGYPAITDASVSDDERREWLRNYIRTYLERDIRDLVNLRELEPFVRMQKTTALLSGQSVNFARLGRETSVSAHTAQRFLRYLELSNQAILLQPWFRNKLKRLTKSPKIHYLDPGIQRAILGKQGAMTGNEFESAIVAEIFKQLKQVQISYDIYHLRTLDGREVDLLIELEKGFIAIEIKITTNISNIDAKHLKDLAEILDKPLLQSFILSNDPIIKELHPGILAMPAAMFLS